jgi:hypothetical protein
MIGPHNALACLPSGVGNERGGSYNIFIIDPPKKKVCGTNVMSKRAFISFQFWEIQYLTNFP